ncbi:2'-5' RNA ligase [Paenibacillus taihuensis]|uniref:RNA 2',3'-cyclic phosphodiesterase n=1 Tax=Paenibacillus taihuensis TaxID=1156355 RepID=A0A3D9R0T3_9BACL|nr:RNA 2',3'-cyclic phosphodiesterase [Paenibacillus taihuensis]REE66668.1 2'-5' RNA ligase [Paenibacillus taihuensis]
MISTSEDDKSSSMRLFVAVPLPDEIKQELKKWINNLQQLPQFTFRKWVHPEDLHITLQFLGDTPRERIPHIIEQLRASVTAITPFQICIKSLGTFGRPSFPSVLWGSIDGEIEQLRGLQQQVISQLSPLGFPPEERPYSPHLTLARKYNREEPFDSSALSLHKAPYPTEHQPLQWQSSSMVLYATHMHRQPMYEAISVISFK